MRTAHHGGVIQAGKYGNKRGMARKLEDGAHQEAEDLWKHSAAADHPAASVKDTIANYVTLGQRKNMESIPYNTFKGKVIPRTYMTMSIDQFAEPDSQPLTPMLSPLEFASLGTVSHLLPPDYLHDKQGSTYSSGRDDIMRAGKTRRYKTSYAKKSGQKTPYQRTDRTSTVLGTGGAAAKALASNKSTVMEASPLDDINGLVGQSKNALITPATIAALGRLVFRYFSGGKIKLTDPDLQAIIRSGLTAGNLSATIDRIPALANIPGLSQLANLLSSSFAGFTLADVFSGAVKAAQTMPSKPSPGETDAPTEGTAPPAEGGGRRQVSTDP